MNEWVSLAVDVSLVERYHIFLSSARSRYGCLCRGHFRGPGQLHGALCVCGSFLWDPMGGSLCPLDRTLFCKKSFWYVVLSPIGRKNPFPEKLKIEWSFVMRIKLKTTGWLMKNNSSWKWLKMWDMVIEDWVHYLCHQSSLSVDAFNPGHTR